MLKYIFLLNMVVVQWGGKKVSRIIVRSTKEQGAKISVLLDICGECVSFSHRLQQVHLLYLSSLVSAGAPRLKLILTSAISELSSKVIMFTLRESSQYMVLMVEC